MFTPTGRTTHTTTADGTIRDWLVTMPWSSSADDLGDFLTAEGSPWGDGGRWVLTNGPDVGPLKERLYQAHQLDSTAVLPEIVEDGKFSFPAHGVERHGAWRRFHTGWDGFVDWSEFCFTPEYRVALAATTLEVDQAEWRTLELSCTGPFVLWLNGEAVLTSVRVSYMEPLTHRVQVRLPSGVSAIHLASWQVGFRECRHIARLRVVGLPVRVVIPSPGADETRARWGEQILEDVKSVQWGWESVEAQLQTYAHVALRVRVDSGDWQSITADGEGLATYQLAPATSDDGSSILRPAALHRVEVQVDDPESPVSRVINVASLPLNSRDRSEGTPEQWRDEVLDHIGGTEVAALRRTAGLLVRHHRDETTRVEEADLSYGLRLVEHRGDCADFELIALIHAWRRIPSEAWPDDLRARVERAICGMKYWIDQPGLDAMCYFTENHQFVWHVAQHLAGLTFPSNEFTNDQRPGLAHAQEGKRRAARWIERKLHGGFSEFDSNAYLAIDSYALVSLIEYTDDEDLRLAAETLLNQILVSLACNSWHGIHAAAHGRSYVQTLRTSRLEETSPILRLIAGVGTLNDAVLPVTALALSSRYTVPAVVRALAAPTAEWWGRQVYRGELAFDRDLLERPYRSDLRVWRTSNVMLSSVTDYRAGLPGLQEHVWGAALGRECQVFMTHPANADSSGSARPNAWAGHRVLPRVHQYRNTLLGLQRFTPTDPAAHTHLWFPRHQFDDVKVSGDWLAGRRGDGYVAIATPGGFRPTRSGDTADQEYLPAEGGAAWLVTVGDAEHGPFGEWFDQVCRGQLSWLPEHGVEWIPVHEPSLRVTFDGVFTVDGVPEGLAAGQLEREPHISNPAFTLGFGADQCQVVWGGQTLEIDVAAAIDAARRAAESANLTEPNRS